jgi:septum formation protein
MPNIASRIYLASRSPRRRELLRQIGVHYEVLLLRESADREDVDETPLPDESSVAYVERIACTKAATGWARLTQRSIPRYPVLGADTAVIVDDEILGKPIDRQAACDMLCKLAGRSHEVVTGVALAYEGRCEVLVNTSVVTFRALDDAEVRAYVSTGEPLDKAGGYAIQGRAAPFITNLSGSYSGVMGLPLYETAQLLERFGIKLFE